MINNNLNQKSIITVRNLKIWSHVGVLESERKLGQEFIVSFSVWLNTDISSATDDISLTVDYSIAIKKIKELAHEIRCHTIEKFSDQILELLDELYGKLPTKITLIKCNPPIDGFNGTVEISKTRNF